MATRKVDKNGKETGRSKPTQTHAEGNRPRTAKGDPLDDQGHPQPKDETAPPADTAE